MTPTIGDCSENGGVSAACSGKAAGILRDMSDAKIDIPNLLPRKNKEEKQRHLTQRHHDSEAQR